MYEKPKNNALIAKKITKTSMVKLIKNRQVIQNETHLGEKRIATQNETDYNKVS